MFVHNIFRLSNSFYRNLGTERKEGAVASKGAGLEDLIQGKALARRMGVR